jgi:hypothetical protein
MTLVRACSRDLVCMQVLPLLSVLDSTVSCTPAMPGPCLADQLKLVFKEAAMAVMSWQLERWSLLVGFPGSKGAVVI